MKGSDEGLTLKDLKLLPWPVYIINSVDHTKLHCYTLPPKQHTVSLETYPFSVEQDMQMLFYHFNNRTLILIVMVIIFTYAQNISHFSG